jgi:hypothetical protein
MLKQHRQNLKRLVWKTHSRAVSAKLSGVQLYLELAERESFQ